MRGPVTFVCATALAALVVSGCGGGDERQDADEPRGTWTVSTDARFPERQRLARQEQLRITVRNTDDRAVPNVAVTVDGLSRRSDRPGLADPNRPVWIVDDAPRGGVTAYTNTWSLGRIPAGGEKEFVWRVTPVVAGRHRVSYRVAAGLDGKAVAELSNGERPEGGFEVDVSRSPSQSRVDPDSGNVQQSD
jgi:hypothetical protein